MFLSHIVSDHVQHATSEVCDVTTIGMESLNIGSPRPLIQLLPDEEIVVAKQRWCIPLCLTLALCPSLFICIVGFLAWGIPIVHLGSAVSPMASALRSQVLGKVVSGVSRTLHRLYGEAEELRYRWNISGQPTNAIADGPKVARMMFPILMNRANMLAGPLVTQHGNCTFVYVLMKINARWEVLHQNCTMQWREVWDPVSQASTGVVSMTLPVFSAEVQGMKDPITRLTPKHPLTWFGIFNPIGDVGDLLEANVGLFDDQGDLIGRAGFAISTADLRLLVQNTLDKRFTHGGRFALYEPNGMVVAASHGKYDRNVRYHLEDIGDADLEQAAVYLHQNFGTVCFSVSTELHLSVPYFLDVTTINDTHHSVQPLCWCALLLAPRANMMDAVDRSNTFAIAFVCITTALIVLLSSSVGLMTRQEICCLTEGLRALAQCDIVSARQVPQNGSLFHELAVARSAYHALVDVIDTFRKYVPEAVVKGLLAGRIQPLLGMKEHHVAIAFMDLENFTAMCGSLSTKQIIIAMAKLFDVCSDLIAKHNGSIDKFIGDCIMAMWGAPIPIDGPGRDAVLCAQAILKWIWDNAPDTSVEGQPLALNIGIHSGVCLVGNFGASTRWGYTAIGDVVHVAARLEPLNKRFGTHCLISSNVQHQMDSDDEICRCLRPMGNVLLVGRQTPLQVYELLSAPSPVPQAWLNALEGFEKGLFSRAEQHLRALPHDIPAKMLQQDMRNGWAHDNLGNCVRVVRST